MPRELKFNADFRLLTIYILISFFSPANLVKKDTKLFFIFLIVHFIVQVFPWVIPSFILLRKKKVSRCIPLINQ